MLDAVADADQLTIVLGHEMAHVILDHSVGTAVCNEALRVFMSVFVGRTHY